MARAVTIGNGSMLVGIDYRGQVRDLYYPYVGYSNHVSGASGSFVHRIGVFVDGEMSWLDDDTWQVEVGTHPETVVGSLTAINEEIGIKLSSIDIVHNEHNIFIRSFVVENLQNKKRDCKLFLAQQFRISESRRGDTGFYDPRVKAIIHYKGTNTFLVNAVVEGKPFSEYNIGLFGIEGKEGTWCDANDGKLSFNAIEHGSVDSVIGCELKFKPKGTAKVDYWIVCGKDIAEVHDGNALVFAETPESLILSTEAYWRAWTDKEEIDLSPLAEHLQILYRRSLTTMRVHTDNGGGMIASSDTDMLHHGRDTYNYVWPRDGAVIAHAFDVAGYGDVAKKFYSFITEKIERGGYLMHKYCTDGTLGSSWHSWIIDGVPEFPIQEDETAAVLYMLYKHYEIEKDLEFIESKYNTFIEPAANFLVEFIESRLGLPQASFDLWEEKFGIHTYTASTVYAALLAAASFAQILGKEEPSRTYNAVAQRVQSAIMEHLYDSETGMFVKSVRATTEGDDIYDRVVDASSFYGPLYFGVIDINDERVKRAFSVVEDKLRVHNNSDGYVRYEGDNYYKMQDADTPNPWVVTTLWIAQYHIWQATNLEELKRAYDLLEWTASHATKSGVLAEQMHPTTRQHLSTAPLIWSHAEYVLAVHAYLDKYKELNDNA